CVASTESTPRRSSFTQSLRRSRGCVFASSISNTSSRTSAHRVDLKISSMPQCSKRCVTKGSLRKCDRTVTPWLALSHWFARRSSECAPCRTARCLLREDFHGEQEEPTPLTEGHSGQR